MITIHRDALWKGFLEDCPEDFLALFFPEFLPLMDLEKGFVFLDKDLATIKPDSYSKNRQADKLFKVWMRIPK